MSQSYWTVPCRAICEWAIHSAFKLLPPLQPTRIWPRDPAGIRRSACHGLMGRKSQRGPFYPHDGYMVLWRAEGSTERHKSARDVQRMKVNNRNVSSVAWCHKQIYKWMKFNSYNISSLKCFQCTYVLLCHVSVHINCMKNISLHNFVFLFIVYIFEIWMES